MSGKESNTENQSMDASDQSEIAPVSQKISDEEIINEARQFFQQCEEAEGDNRKEEIDDLRFMAGDQWPDDVKNSRIQDSRPCLTINRIPQFVRQVTNDQRQNRPAIKINPVDDHADVDTADIFQGLVRHIEYNSHSDIAIDTAFAQAAKGGLGYFRLITEYADPLSFQQEIKFKQIKNRFSVYVDPFFQEPDGSDMEKAIIFDEMSQDEYKALYPKSKASSMADWESLGDISNGWVKKDAIRVGEFYRKEYESDVEIVLLSNGKVLEKSHLSKIQLPDGIKVVQERKTTIPRVKWYKINGLEILERTDIPGPWIPVIPVIGEEELVDGKRIFSGVIRHAKDPQRMYNYWKSAQTEAIALAPKAPFIIAEGQIEGYEAQWESANVKNHAVLTYKPTTIAGQPVAPPQRNNAEPATQAITSAAMEAADDLKATTGIYDATLGNRSNELSGVAIQRRNAQAQTSNFHFMDNLTRSLRHAGRIIINWIPKVYDTPQTVRIIGEDGTVDMVKVNQIFKDKDGSEKSYFLDVGRYDVTVETGPSYQTKRQEAVASMLDMSRAVPQLMGVAGDIMVRNMDWPGSQEIADRLKKTIPPNLIDDKDQPQVPPQAQAKIQQMQQMIQQMSQIMEQDAEIIKTKRLELESKERIAALDAETKLKLELIKHDAKDSQIAFQEEMREIQHIRDMTQNIYSSQAGGPNPAAPGSDPNMPTGGPTPGQPMGGNP